ncbi:enhancer of polycomb-like protein 1 [Rhizoctonia solani]|uniref:Enhancer of polycomb-like protein n=1 Tax=Rhizoctonia solani TaxID=456999 RepID=A0A8H8PAY8_9AGAM|nr:enhancer of polycomb-like protein 1 [Rhizoctonia solani]QRW27457.1 enhancer of polycomb-like protein 1 [Rhizoctonia solani]
MRGNATGYGTKSRSKPRLTNKLKLVVHHGDIDADQPAIDDEDEKNKVSSTAGVDAEDSHEHHLQAVLSAASLRASGQPRASGSSAYIPTPDAAGHAPDWERYYTANRWEEPEGYVRFSDTVEETQVGAIAAGCTYYMDEVDAEWLSKNNAELTDAARASSPSRGLPRSAKARGKEPESPSVAITEDEFELVMGILERITDERHPCLHADVSKFPTLTDFEPVFSNRLPISFFPDYRVPDSVPPPAQLLRMFRVIYPHWRERRLERDGRRIIPQINSDETNEGDPYVCFRRRDAKPVRKTRRSDTGSVDRMQSLFNNIRQLQHIAQSVVRREQLKHNRALEERQIMNCRMNLAEVKRKFPTTPFGSRDDDEVLVDKIVKRPKLEGTNTIRLSRRPTVPTPQQAETPTPSGPTEMPDPRAVAAANRKKVDEFMQRNPQQERWWDDLTDATYMPLPRPLLPNAKFAVFGYASVEVDEGSSTDGPPPVRPLRAVAHLVENRWEDWRGAMALKLKNGEVVTEEEFERAIVLSERWRYDRDERLEENVDQPIVVDDYADRFILSRLARHSIEDYELLSSDQSAILQHLIPSQHRTSIPLMALDQARQLQRLPPPLLTATATPPSEPTITASPVPTTTVTPATASRLQALAMQQKAQVQARPSSTQPQVAIRQSRPPVGMPNGKPLSNGTPPAVQRPGSAQGTTITTNGTPTINVPGTTGAMVIPGAGGVGTLNGTTAGGLAVPQQQRGSASPHDNRGGSPLRPLSSMANGTAPNPTAQAAYQQLTQQQQIELKRAFHSQNGGIYVNGMMGTPPIQLTLPQQRPQWNRTPTARPGVTTNGVTSAQASPPVNHGSPTGQLLSVPQTF